MPQRQDYRSELTRPMVVAIGALVVAVTITGCGSSPTAPTVPAPPLYTLSGVVTVPAGEPLQGVLFQVGTRSAVSDATGRYSIPDLQGLPSIKVSKDGYEDLWVTPHLTPGGVSPNATLNVTLQPTIRMAPGDITTVTLEATDAGYDFPSFYEACERPCKVLRFSAPGSGSLTITFSSRDPSRTLIAYTDGGAVSHGPASAIKLRLLLRGAGEVVIHMTSPEGLPPGLDARIDLLSSFEPQ